MKFLDAIEQYKQATEKFIDVASGLTPKQLDKDQHLSWTARQVIHHVADSETQSYARLRRLIVEPGTLIQGYDEAAWGENDTLGYKELPVENALVVIRAVRTSSLEVLSRLNINQLGNSGTHTETGPYTLETWLISCINHPLEHAEQIRLGLTS